MPATKAIASFKLPNYNSGKVPSKKYLKIYRRKSITRSYYLIYYNCHVFLFCCGRAVEVQYFHDHATVTSAVGLNQSPAVDVTATMGSSPSFAFGAEAGYHDTSALRGSYAVDPLTSVKYTLNNHGKLAALMQHELKLKSF
ncbi:hypothetical protein MKW92_030053 [Papaver armeniacum]|nr:hypothetical protein MKW92_030053 [Papaver armeniacum]